MIGKRFFKKSVTGLVILFLLGLTTDCFAAKKPEKINIGVPIDLSGPYSTILANYHLGYKDVVNWINDNGGVKGVPLNLVVMDTGAKVPRAISAFDQIMRSDPRPVAFVHQHSTEQEALKKRYIEEKMANHSNSGAYGVLSPPSTQFSNMAAGYAPAFARFMKWWKDNEWPKKGIQRNPRMAMITWDIAFGKAPLTKESLAYLKDELKIDYVGSSYIPFFPTDTTSQLLSARAAGADIIMGWYHVGAFSVLLKDAMRLGLKDKIDFGNVITGTEYILPRLAGRQAAEGVYAVTIHPFWDEMDIPGVVLLNKIFKDNNRDPEKDKLFGYTTALNIFLTIKQVCEVVVDEYGWEGLNSENYLKVLNSGRSFDVMGTTPPVKYVGNTRVLSHMKVGRIVNGQLIGVSDWLKCPNLWPKEWGWEF
ncbi:ABC transporter substrate-binding protein [bacterium]|nr:ABC transporter substrate-binding protein [bacterium]